MFRLFVLFLYYYNEHFKIFGPKDPNPKNIRGQNVRGQNVRGQNVLLPEWRETFGVT